MTLFKSHSSHKWEIYNEFIRRHVQSVIPCENVEMKWESFCDTQSKTILHKVDGALFEVLYCTLVSYIAMHTTQSIIQMLVLDSDISSLDYMVTAL